MSAKSPSELQPEDNGGKLKVPTAGDVKKTFEALNTPVKLWHFLIVATFAMFSLYTPVISYHDNSEALRRTITDTTEVKKKAELLEKFETETTIRLQVHDSQIKEGFRLTEINGSKIDNLRVDVSGVTTLLQDINLTLREMKRSP